MSHVLGTFAVYLATCENDSWQLWFAAMSMTQLTLHFSLLTSHCRFVLSFREVYYLMFMIYNDNSDKIKHSNLELLFRNMKM